MKRVLFLDDDEERHKLVEKYTIGRDMNITHVWNFDQAVQELQDKVFDAAWLDHDLCIEDQMCNPYDSKEKNGTALANWMRDNLPIERWPTTIIVHSFNGPGAREMLKIFVEAGHAKHIHKPFGTS